MRRASLTAWLLVLFSCGPAVAATRSVGPGKAYAAPCAAFAAAQDGDVIEIDAAGTYEGDVCAITKNGLTIRGVAGLPVIDAKDQNAQGKAIWVISGNDTIVDTIEFTGAKVPDKNGAGIRQEGKNLTVRGCYFHDNEDGILAGDNAESTITIERSIFDHNGAGDGQSHNLYINHVGKLVFQYNWSARAVVGHLLKTRAAENHILYNRLTGEDGTESYEIDVPNGGATYVVGNIVQQGASTENPALLAYQQEGENAANPSHALFVVNNTFVNDRGGPATFVAMGPSVNTKAVIKNNVFAGGGTITAQAGATLANNVTDDPKFADAALFNYHVTQGSPCIDKAEPPGTVNGVDLTPVFSYTHPAHEQPRVVYGTGLDIGAYEYIPPGAAGAPSSGGAGGASSTGGTTASGGAATTGGVTSTGGAPASGGSRPSSGGATSTGGAASSQGGAPSASGGASSPDAGEPAGGGSKEDSGCNCRVGAGERPSTALAVALALALAVTRRRQGRDSKVAL